MTKRIFVILVVAAAFTLLAQEITHDVSVINIEIPVRVFHKGKFVDDLRIEDFEVFEDGELQKIEAVYLIKKTDIKREDTELKKEEARRKFAPEVSRHFLFSFEVTDYLPKIKDTVDYFFQNVITPKDSLVIVSPVKSYRFKKESLAAVPREVIAKKLNEKLRKDITMGCR